MNTNLRAIILGITLLLTVVTIGITTTLAEPQRQEFVSSTKAEQGYILKDYNGSLAIFEGNSAVPLEILDVKTNSLPERDIEILKNGLHAKTLNEIISMAEDYE